MVFRSWLKSLPREITHAQRCRAAMCRRSRKRWALLEQLEERTLLAATVLVTNTDDSGAGSLRQAIIDANNNSGPDTIEFNIPVNDPRFVDVDSGMTGGDVQPDVFVIQPESALPTLSDDGTTIDGRTQAGSIGNTNPFGPEIVIDGSQISTNGLVIDSDDNRISGLNIQGSSNHGIFVRGNDNWIDGNFIGTDATGTDARGNGRDGVLVDPGASDNLIGTDGDGKADDAERNIISGNFGHGEGERWLGTWTVVTGSDGHAQFTADLQEAAGPGEFVTATATASDGSTSEFFVLSVSIDVKPGSERNPINLSAGGVIPVAVMTTDDFDAASIDASTVVFAGAAADRWSLEDVDRDGDLDMVLHFQIRDTALLQLYQDRLQEDLADGTLDSRTHSAVASLTGQTIEGDFFAGFDEVDLFLSDRDLEEMLQTM